MYVHFPVSDVEQIDAIMPEAHSRILQYSSGRLAASSACLVLPKLRVVRNESNQGLLIEISVDNDALDIVLLEYASDAVNWMGQELASNSLIIFPLIGRHRCLPMSLSMRRYLVISVDYGLTG